MEQPSYFLTALLRETKSGESDVLRIAERLHASNLHAARLWQDISPDLACKAAIAMIRASRDDLNIDISSFAAMVDLPRSSAHRLLTEWQALGYCTLNPVGNRTYVVATPVMIEKSARYIDFIARNA